jgi:7,8-dihydropterin-6-yl-methyl-4-(beta-D-ribofuranosyl)aminobenzene 5'-phosphate synthase
VLSANARTLGIDVLAADTLVLSHGHNDHTGGLPSLLERVTVRPRVCAHPAVFRQRYSTSGGNTHPAGSPLSQERALILDANLELEPGPRDLGQGWRLTGEVPRHTGFEDTGGGFSLDPEATLPDELPDDQALYLDTPAGCLVFLGCAHAGVVNTLRHIRTLSGGKPILALLGGMHLGRASQERMDRTLAELADLEIPLIAPCHCTGVMAVTRLASAFPEAFRPCHAGSVFEWPAF